MPRMRAIAGTLAVAAFAAAAGGCGGEDEDGPIPQEQGDTLLTQLDQIDAAVEQGRCDDAQTTAVAFAASVDGLPPEVEGELREALVDASVNLENLATEQCKEPDTGPSGETGTVSPPTTSTTETTETTTTETEPPPGEGPGRGNGPPDEPPGGGNGNPGGGDDNGDDDSSGGIGSDG